MGINNEKLSYRLLDDDIEILRIVNGRRNLPAIFKDTN